LGINDNQGTHKGHPYAVIYCIPVILRGNAYDDKKIMRGMGSTEDRKNQRMG